MKRIIFLASLFLFAHTFALAQTRKDGDKPDLNRGRTLYTVGYVHLDTQWNWDYTKTIDVFLKRTLERNFDLFEKYPDYIFTFTGARRYRMMKEYYPDLYAKMLGYVRQGRWIAGGSCVEESEVNVSSSESMIREVLYGNAYYEREFGYRSIDYMLPDCFGFVASMPSVLAHAGIEGFSTQKLTWRSAAGIPFNVGFWQGPDGKGVVAALNATKYAGRIPERLDRDSAWIARIDANIARHGLHFDYRYYGVGDRGGSPRPDDVKNAVGSIGNPDSEIDVRLTSSQQMFEDLTPALKRKLPVYAGDLLLIEHSAGSTTSQVFMKRMNRKNELLAKAAEQVAAGADAAGIARYPFEKINPAWELILGSQMHDILPGTAIPQAYEYSWNDEFVAANLLASTLENAVSRMAARMDTRTAGHPLVVYNPVAAERNDIAEATLALPADTRSVIVRDADGNILPSQIVSREGNRIGFVFGCRMKPMSMEVFDVEPSAEPEQTPAELKVDGRTLENACYRVVIARNGDIESIFDKRLGRQLLTAPARLEFLHESPRQWPAWNMDWKDRRQAPVAFMDENAAVRIVERGPVRATLEVSRQGRDSRIVQRISLAAGEAGRRIEVDNRIDWQSTGVSLKAAFPLAAANPEASYSLNTAVVERGNNDSLKFEVPSREWFDLTDRSGRFGVSVLEDCRYGSDKPDDNTLRLTLMYTPEANVPRFTYQATQDFGIHDVKYALYGHEGGWDNGTPWQAKFLNQPLLTFATERHDGDRGRRIALAVPSTEQIDIMAFKKMEESPYYVVRVNELFGKACDGATIEFPSAVAEAFEVDGQERRIGKATVRNGKLTFDIGKFGIRSFAVRFADTSAPAKPVQEQLLLAYDADILSDDAARSDGRMGRSEQTLPAEMLPDTITSEGIDFAIRGREKGADNAVECRGQQIALPAGDYDRIYLLAAAEEEAAGCFEMDGAEQWLDIAKWKGFVGQHYAQTIVPDSTAYKTLAVDNPYLRKDPIAWFASHCHAPKRNIAYQYCYLYKYGLDIVPGAKTLTLPDNPCIKIVAVTVAKEGVRTVPLTPLYDDFDDYPVFRWRNRPKFDLSHR
ncbi:MAG: alpha-mannosidase [Alistipes sp.]|jgi:hypothetical protein|uniref:glycoside hydrolase family 38 C-terminal domain-containing protein n=1 Tax=Alistipes sp. TaxID=1872444 RepID=UPI0023F2B492|nr:glycoside hydrolase family 38 C-terminal domain-containing protein [Alistipes sp.]MBS5556003.1 alpha-mannosidase [Alistipes sp.]